MKKLILILFLLVSITGFSQVFDYQVKAWNLQVDTTYTEGDLPEETGSSYWDVGEETITDVLTNGVRLQRGHEIYFDVLNQTGSILTNGKVAKFAGAVGASGKLKAAYAIADGTMPAEYTIGVFTQDIANGDQGKVTWFGKVRGIQTNGANYGETWADGDILYLSPITAGALTKVKPNAPYPAIQVAAVIKAHATMGTLQVRPSFPLRLQDLSDVNGTPLDSTGQIPVWNNTNQYFDFTENINSRATWPATSGIPYYNGTGWGTSITDNSANWNTAYGWGNHAGLYAPASGSGNYIQNQNASAQTANMWISGNGTFDGYGSFGNANLIRILNVKSTSGPALRLEHTASNAGIEMSTQANKRSWLFGAQYNIDQTFEITPSTIDGGFTFSNPAFSINYLGAATFASTVNSTGYLLNGNNLHSSLESNTLAKWDGSKFVSVTDNSGNWNTAFGWGNHASAGYLTSFTETDPTIYAWAKASTKPAYTYTEVGAQEALVSGTNIKTINGSSLLGSGDLTISGGTTNLGYTASATNGIVTSDTGTDATIPAGSTTNASLMLPSDKTKLNGIASGADNYGYWAFQVNGGSPTTVPSANTLNFIAGTNMTITPSGLGLTFSSTGGGSGTVTSVGLSAPTGFSVSGSPVTTSGTLALSFAAGYSLPSDATQANWTTAYNNRIATFTTTGNSGAATFSGNTLNIPNYTLSGLGGQPAVGANVSFGYNGNWVALDGSLVRYSNTILQRFADIGGGTYVGSTFPSASTTEAGLMSATDKTNLDAAVSNSGKVTVGGGTAYGDMSSTYFNIIGGSIVPKVDSSPTDGSSLPTTSNAVYDGLALKANLSGAAFTGAISSTSTMTATDFILSSDRRLKTKIRPLTNTDWVRNIQLVSYQFKSDSTENTRYGVIAQDVQEVNKHLVHTDNNGNLSVSYIDLLIAKIADLEKRIKQLENEK